MNKIKDLELSRWFWIIQMNPLSSQGSFKVEEGSRGMHLIGKMQESSMIPLLALKWRGPQPRNTRRVWTLEKVRKQSLLQSLPEGTSPVNTLVWTFFFFNLWPHVQYMEVPRLRPGVKSELQPTLHPQQHQIQAAPMAYTTAHGIIRSSTH